MRADSEGNKRCTSCDTVKNVSDFYRSRRELDGRHGHCKQCHKRGTQLSCSKESAKIAKAERCRRYRSSEDSRSLVLARDKRHAMSYRSRYPEKVKAAQIVNRAIKNGTMIPSKRCVECGEIPRSFSDGRRSIQAHHHRGYGNPMDVIWLCVRCHNKEHGRALKKGKV